MIVNQWVPAAHKGDAIGDSARRMRGLLRQMGHRSEIYALTIDDELKGDVHPFGDSASRAGDLRLPARLTHAELDYIADTLIAAADEALGRA